MEILNAHVEAIRAYLNEEALQVQEAGARAFSSGDSAQATLLIDKLTKLQTLRDAVDYVEKTVVALDAARDQSLSLSEDDSLIGVFHGSESALATESAEVSETPATETPTHTPAQLIRPDEPTSQPPKDFVLEQKVDRSNGNGHLHQIHEMKVPEQAVHETKVPEQNVLDEIAPVPPAIAITEEERKVLLEMLHDGKIAVTQTTNRLVDATDQGNFSESMYKSTICRARGMIELGIKLGTSVSSIREDVELLKQRFNTNAKNHSFFGLNPRRELPYDQWLEFSDAYEWMTCVPKALHMIDEGLIESEIDRSQVLMQCAATTTLVRALLSELTDSVKDHEQFRLEGILRDRGDLPFIRWWRAISLTDEIMDLQDHAALLPDTLERILNRRLDMVDLSLRYR